MLTSAIAGLQQGMKFETATLEGNAAVEDYIIYYTYCVFKWTLVRLATIYPPSDSFSHPHTIWMPRLVRVVGVLLHVLLRLLIMLVILDLMEDSRQKMQ